MNQSQNKSSNNRGKTLQKSTRVIQLDLAQKKTKLPENELGDTMYDFKKIFGFDKQGGAR